MATASSVSGVGPGSALKSGQKGAGDEFLGIDHLIGPHVVHAGSVTLADSAGVFVFPTTLPGVAGDYIVLLFNATLSTRAVSYTLTTASLTLAGTTSDVINFSVVRTTKATATIG